MPRLRVPPALQVEYLPVGVQQLRQPLVDRPAGMQPEGEPETLLAGECRQPRPPLSRLSTIPRQVPAVGQVRIGKSNMAPPEAAADGRPTETSNNSNTIACNY